MKLMTKLTISSIAIAMFSGCIGGGNISEESLGLRKTDLYSELSTTGDKAQYGKQYAGGSTKIKRAFQDAPPMIPHDTEGMLPIKISDNQCIACHMPEVAKSMNATPIPISHFINFRAKIGIAKNGKVTKNGKKINNTSREDRKDIYMKKSKTLVKARFNCSQCHAPQSKGLAVENTFSPDFTDKDGASKSNWSGSKLLEGLDTLVK